MLGAVWRGCSAYNSSLCGICCQPAPVTFPPLRALGFRHVLLINTHTHTNKQPQVQFKIATPAEEEETKVLRAELSDRNTPTRDSRGFRHVASGTQQLQQHSHHPNHRQPVASSKHTLPCTGFAPTRAVAMNATLPRVWVCVLLHNL